MLGRTALAMWWDVPPEARAEWEDWHSHEHMPERLGIPGFLRGTRWIARGGEPSYFVLYEAARFATVTTGPYLERLNHPTPWSRKLMPHHRNMVRSLCRVRASCGGVAQALATIRFSAPRGATAVAKWLAAETLPRLPMRSGLTAAHLLESQPVAGMHETVEQGIRGRDAAADWIVLVGGYDFGALEALAAKQLGADALAARGAALDATGIYCPAHSLVPRDL